MDHDAALAALRQSQLPRVLLSEDVAAAFRVSRGTARHYCRTLLPSSRVGGKYVVLRDDLLRWLSARAARREPLAAGLHLVPGSDGR